MYLMEIQGFSNYLIYPDGRVSSKRFSDKFLKQHLQGKKRNYYSVKLYNEVGSKTIPVHRLVAEHYIANPENKPTVDHINRNTKDNRIVNLRWATYKEQRKNQGNYSNCSSGHIWIHYCKNEKKWKYTRRDLGRFNCCKRFNTKTDALCYKFIHILKSLN